MAAVEADDDNDGVVNDLDACPGTPAGAAVDARGCELDRDGDGVVNSLDRCPGTPAGSAVNAFGCLVELRLGAANFASGSATLSAGG